ncbi:MAG TPA: hypothetical protein VNQ53_02820 [Nocardioides sp.]|nr:hypothetical protein [Nocardioides sp.]
MTTITDALTPPIAPERPAAEVPLVVEYWTVTMGGQASCGSCDDTLANVNTALDMVGLLAERLDLAIQLVPRTVTTWADAVSHGIVASPTLRAAGLELRPSHRDASETRLWRWRGATTASANPDAVADFLVRALGARSAQIDEYFASGGPAPYVRQFLRAAPAMETALAAEVSASGSCGCGPSTEG